MGTLPETPVRRSVSQAVPHLSQIEVDEQAVIQIAEAFATEELPLPEWRAPVFPDGPVSDVIDFLFVGNAINFQFRNHETGANFTATYRGTDWTGAFGMWACLKRAYDADSSILRGDRLRELSQDDVAELFESADGMAMPMLEDRHQILTSVGRRLDELYDGRFATLVSEAAPRLYADGEGLVERLTAEFPSYRDSAMLETTDGDLLAVTFSKRSQLAVAMAYGRYHTTDELVIEDPDAFTIFADYNLPNVLRSLGILVYSDRLAARIERGELLEAGSRDEVELRTATVYAADLLIEAINERRRSPIYAPHLDYKLFAMRGEVATPVHLTRTTAY